MAGSAGIISAERTVENATVEMLFKFTSGTPRKISLLRENSLRVAGC